MRKNLSVILFFISLTASASHIIGGNFSITQTGRNDFNVELTIFKDCRPGTVQLQDYIIVRIFDRSDFSNYYDLTLYKNPGDTLSLGDKCFSPPSLCIEAYVLSGSVTLPDNPAGYIIAAQVCCRNQIIDNIQNPDGTGMTWTTIIPDPALPGGNSTPDLGGYPLTGFLCLNNLRLIDLSTSDPDGDSLAYKLITPLNAPQPSPTNPISPPAAPPYSDVYWSPSYSVTDAIHGNPSLMLDAKTGLLKCNPSQLGVYVFSYLVIEYRNGLEIGETRRDLQFEVLNCITDAPPKITSPQDSAFTFEVEKENCIAVQAIDPNSGDSIKLSFEITADAISGHKPETNGGLSFGSVTGNICWFPDCSAAFNNKSVQVKIKASSRGCLDTMQSVSKLVYINIPPVNPVLNDLFPNIFTPNGDGKNDFLIPTDPNAYPCLQQFHIKVFNRWGIQVYEADSGNFSWDGTYKSAEVASGVYYLIISGNFGDTPFEKKMFVTLMR